MTTPLYRTEAERLAAEELYVAQRMAIYDALHSRFSCDGETAVQEFRTAFPVIRPTRAEVLDRAAKDFAEMTEGAEWRGWGIYKDWLTAFIREYEEATP